MSESFDWAALLNKAKAGSLEPVPDNTYHVVVHEAESVMSSTGKPMIKLKLKIADGQYQNKPLMTQLVLSIDNDIALAMFFNNLKCFGITPEFLAQCPPGSLAPIATALVGKHANAKVGHKEWQGEMRNEVKGFVAIKVGTGLPVMGTPSNGSTLPGLPGLSGSAQPSPAAAPTTALPGLSLVKAPEQPAQSVQEAPAAPDALLSEPPREFPQLSDGDDPF